MDRLVLLGKIPLIEGLPTEQLLAVSEIADEDRFEADETIFEKGSRGHHLYLLVKGRVRVLSGDVELAVLDEGECFGELALLDHSTRSASVKAIDPVICLKIARSDFEDLLDVSPDLARTVMSVISHRLRDCLKQD